MLGPDWFILVTLAGFHFPSIVVISTESLTSRIFNGFVCWG